MISDVVVCIIGHLLAVIKNVDLTTMMIVLSNPEDVKSIWLHR